MKETTAKEIVEAIELLIEGLIREKEGIGWGKVNWAAQGAEVKTEARNALKMLLMKAGDA